MKQFLIHLYSLLEVSLFLEGKFDGLQNFANNTFDTVVASALLSVLSVFTYLFIF